MKYSMGLLFFLMANVWAASHHPNVFLEQIKGATDEGEQIVQHFCSTCHAEKPLVPLGAPKPKNVTDWAARLNQGLETLFQHTNEGLRAMPPRGGCFECTDEQLWLAIKALLPSET